MAFGSDITTLNQDAIGSAGYIVKIDTVYLLAHSIEQVQAQIDPDDTPAPVSEEVAYSTLYGYLNDSGCPDLAFANNEGELAVFLKTTVFPYLSTTRIAVFGKRIAQNASVDADLLDVPDKDIELVKAYALKEAYSTAKGGYVPKSVNDTIKVEERRINNE